MEKTVIIFKPDSLANKHAGEILKRFEEVGFEICACKMLALSKDILREHYAHILYLLHYPVIEAFMLERPLLILVLKLEDAVNKARDMVGPTDSNKAKKGTIRGDFGTDIMRNVVHASDSIETANIEIKRFFSSDEIYDQ